MFCSNKDYRLLLTAYPVVRVTFKYKDLWLKISHEGAARVRYFQPRVHRILFIFGCRTHYCTSSV